MSDTLINLIIDGVEVTCEPELTILKAAVEAGIHIPTICVHEACTANALCRMCVVEVQGARTLVPACVAKVSEGMVVTTSSERVNRARKTILEMLASTVDLSDSPEILSLLAEYHADPARFESTEQRTSPILDDNPMYIRDYSKCVLCWRCVQVCAADVQYAFAINFKGRGFHTQISTFFDKPLQLTTCVFCGQCVGVCPTGALKPKRQWLLEEGQTPDAINALGPSGVPGRKRRRQQEVK
jgi:NADH dehydrogenase/NADH:ubiquinone oxidoreductase subunit G